MINRDSLASSVDFRAAWLVRSQWIGLFAMILATWPLWFANHSIGDADEFVFPSVPLFESLVGAGIYMNWFVSGFVLLGILSAAGFSFSKRPLAETISLMVVVLAIMTAVSLNQHRFLPWVYQSILVFVASLLLGRLDFLRFFRMLIVSIYVFSAISKFDYQFVHSTGRMMFKMLASFMGMDVTNWSNNVVVGCVLCFPLFELLIGIGLLFAATRFVAMLGASLMHLSLILILGPWGLGNAESVLLWNLLFISQVFLLYWPARVKAEPDERRALRTSYWYAGLICILVFVPVMEKFNLVDHWPAWGLYSPRASRCKLYVPEWKAEQLEPEFKKYLRRGSHNDFQVMREFDLAAWSIDSKNAPIYPQDRFQFGVARFLVEKLDLQRSFMIEVQSASNAWTGERRIEKITDIGELNRYGDKKFLVNVDAY